MEEEARDEEEPVPEERLEGADSSAEGVVGTEGVEVGAGAGRAFDLGGGARGLTDARGEVGVETEEGESACLFDQNRGTGREGQFSGEAVDFV
jgi:hypothetical protein